MDIIKGLTRLQSNIETLLASAESAEDSHLPLLKRCHSQLNLFILNPETIDVALIDQLAVELSLRSRSGDQLPEEDYDKISVGLKLLAKMRQSEIERSYGPSSPEELQEGKEQPKKSTNKSLDHSLG